MLSTVSSVSKISCESIPGDILCSIADFLDVPSTLKVIVVCKRWQEIIKDHPNYRQLLLFKSRYAPALFKAFQARGISISGPPVLDLNTRKLMRQVDYIGRLTLEDLTAPLMTFEDENGSVGFAFRWRGKFEGEVWVENPSDVRPIKSVSGVFAVFKYKNEWMCKKSESFRLIQAIQQKAHASQHQERFSYITCPACPPFIKEDFLSFIANLIRGADPAIEIDANIN